MHSHGDTAGLKLSPRDLLEKLVALVPLPRVHCLAHGILGSVCAAEMSPVGEVDGPSV